MLKKKKAQPTSTVFAILQPPPQNIWRVNSWWRRANASPSKCCQMCLNYTCSATRLSVRENSLQLILWWWFLKTSWCDWFTCTSYASGTYCVHTQLLRVWEWVVSVYDTWESIAFMPAALHKVVAQEEMRRGEHRRDNVHFWGAEVCPVC